MTKAELGGSEYYSLKGYLGSSVPMLKAEKAIDTYRRLTSAIDAGLVRACHDLSEGGLAVAAAEMAFTGGLGIELNLKAVPVEAEIREDLTLFSESNGRLLVEVPPWHRSRFEEIMAGSVYSMIGSVTERERLTIQSERGPVIDLSLDQLMKAWKTPLEGPV
jgi:phosphoribosylformylglycinamidine synthase